VFDAYKYVSDSIKECKLISADITDERKSQVESYKLRTRDLMFVKDVLYHCNTADTDTLAFNY